MALCGIRSASAHVAALVEAMRIYFGALALLAILAFAPAQTAEPCVAVKFTLHAYSGPIVIEDACLVAHTYTAGSLAVEARDMGDGIFKNGFDPEDTP